MSWPSARSVPHTTSHGITNPRSSQWIDKLKKSVPAPVFAKYERCKAAHKNSIESMALFTTAVVLRNMARLPVGMLNAAVGGYLALRVAYLAAYINITSN